MPLTDQQTKQLLDSAKARGLTREQAREVLVQENQRLVTQQPQQESGILGKIGRGLWDLYNVPSRMAGGQLRTATQTRKGEYQAPDLGSFTMPTLQGPKEQQIGELILPNIVGAFRGLRDKTDMFEATPEAFGVEPDTALGIGLGFAGEVATPDILDAVDLAKLIGKGRKASKAVNLRVPGGENLEEVTKIAKKMDIELPTSAKTSNQFVRQTEAMLQKGLFGNEITKKITKAFDDVAGVHDNIVAKFAKEQDMDAIGKVIKNNLDDFADEFQKTKRVLYGNVPQSVKKVKVDPTNTLKALDETIATKSKGLFPDSFVTRLAKVRKELAEKSASKTGVTYEVLDETQKQIGGMVSNFADPVAVGNKGVLRKLYASTAMDLDEALKVANPDAFEAIKAADEFYADGVNLLKDKTVKSILRKNPTEIFNYLSKPGKEQELATLKKLMGEDDFAEFSGEVLQKLFNESVDNKGVIKSAKLEKNISKYGEKSLRNLLSREQFGRIVDLRKQLGEIELVEEALKAGNKPAVGSQTAFLLQQALTGAGFLVNPLAAINYIIGSKAVTSAFESPLMQQILTTGVSKSLDASPLIDVGSKALRAATVAGPELLKTQFRPQQIKQKQLSPIERALEKETQTRQERPTLP